MAVNGPTQGDDGFATLAVSDTGTGFTPEYESKRHGLSLVRRLIEQVRGTVEITSDHGTIWKIRFPTELMTLPGDSDS